MKICGKCKIEKSPIEFPKSAGTKDGLDPRCKICHRKAQKEWYKKNLDKRKNIQRKYKYGLTKEEYTSMLSGQGGKCAICRQPNNHKRDWHIDHCHVTNKVRGILCAPCNIALGLLKEDTIIIEQMLKYIARYNNIS